MEAMEGCFQRSALVLADPMAEGVAKDNGEPVGGMGQDVGRSTKGEG